MIIWLFKLGDRVILVLCMMNLGHGGVFQVFSPLTKHWKITSFPGKYFQLEKVLCLNKWILKEIEMWHLNQPLAVQCSVTFRFEIFNINHFEQRGSFFQYFGVKNYLFLNKVIL